VTDLFLAPHNDDETLFGSFTLLAHLPTVVICFKSQVQEDRYGIFAATREKETERALWNLGVPSMIQSEILDTDPRGPEKLLDELAQLDRVHAPERVWAPAYEEDGHEQHNVVSYAANGIFGNRVQPYLTYRRGSMRTRGTEVYFRPDWVIRKMRALCCYESQIALDNTRPWFMDDTLREYVP
jgi:LmbE family N-acetylglucosaminyl deacetylase